MRKSLELPDVLALGEEGWSCLETKERSGDAGSAAAGEDAEFEFGAAMVVRYKLMRLTFDIEKKSVGE